MTTFKEIRGTAIQVVSSDPSNPETGQIWYNSSSGTLKGYVFATVNAWAAGGNYPVATNGNAATGTQTAGLSWSGYTTTYTSAANLYNGTAWTATGSVNRSSYYSIGAGNQTATIKFGGESTTASYDNYVETFNGSTWTANPATLNNGRSFLGGCGTQTAALALCGQIPPSGAGSNYTEKWNGTSWTSSGNYPSSYYGTYAFGSQTAAIASGGGFPTVTTSSSFNGTSWTSIPSLNTARYMHGGAGTATAGLVFGGIGSPGSVISATELYNGTSWTSNPTGLATGRRNVGACGTQSLALFAGGDAGPAYTASTEEWTGQALQTKTLTVS